ncbi:MAG: response regulator transcription factor [Acholeplasmataceae bacterium]|nr:response regulator transcription factor [Acholeplasmataceae bacterium]
MAIVYYVEDDQSIGYIIEKTIEHAGLSGYGFQDGEALLEKYKHQKPDMILLDVMLPGMSGLDVLKQIRKHDKETPIMMISALQSEMDKVIALDFGADDYMTKPFGVLELVSRIQSKLRKNYYDQIYQLNNLSLDDKKHLCMINDQEVYLTNKEYSILKLLLRNKNSVVSKEAIFKDVWETDFIGETRTLDMHIKSLRQKLQAKEAIADIKTIRGIGYTIE